MVSYSITLPKDLKTEEYRKNKNTLYNMSLRMTGKGDANDQSISAFETKFGNLQAHLLVLEMGVNDLEEKKENLNDQQFNAASVPISSGFNELSLIINQLKFSGNDLRDTYRSSAIQTIRTVEQQIQVFRSDFRTYVEQTLQKKRSVAQMEALTGRLNQSVLNYLSYAKQVDLPSLVKTIEADYDLLNEVLQKAENTSQVEGFDAGSTLGLMHLGRLKNWSLDMVETLRESCGTLEEALRRLDISNNTISSLTQDISRLHNKISYISLHYLNSDKKNEIHYANIGSRQSDIKHHKQRKEYDKTLLITEKSRAVLMDMQRVLPIISKKRGVVIKNFTHRLTNKRKEEADARELEVQQWQRSRQQLQVEQFVNTLPQLRSKWREKKEKLTNIKKSAGNEDFGEKLEKIAKDLNIYRDFDIKDKDFKKKDLSILINDTINVTDIYLNNIKSMIKSAKNPNAVYNETYNWLENVQDNLSVVKAFYRL
ncbi:hypothetical protein GE253_24265 [Niveispirillum sp. SYP-B3756]|uniref:hypothetical protein n=1 Tax=Niveispirillum sp. SYP-B3756 TaxID=2662178 RepID=UPI001291D29C|nr:hypothetical protein [Niveispirillum sp. SYP-B3756]MQP68438.1 hypothetical protein [Niveispirillum sp. SYP-B3756]